MFYRYSILPFTHMTLVFFSRAATFVTGLRGGAGLAHKAGNRSNVFIRLFSMVISKPLLKVKTNN